MAFIDRAIEDFAVDQGAAIVYPDYIRQGWFWTGALRDDLVLETAGGGDDAGFFRIGSQEILSYFLIADGLFRLLPFCI